MAEDIKREADPLRKRHGKRLGRELAMAFLFSCDMRGETPRAELFDSFFETAASEYADVDAKTMHRALEYAVRLYVAAALRREEIDAILIPMCVNWDWKRISAVDRSIMRVAVAEMIEFDEIPPVVSIDEAVEIARDFSGTDDGNFINGVLNAVKNKLVSPERASL